MQHAGGPVHGAQHQHQPAIRHAREGAGKLPGEALLDLGKGQRAQRLSFPLRRQFGG